jgi:hypothetical protein
MTLRVIGAGLGRTGTSSLTAALSQLLGGSCYHFEEVIQHPEHVDFWRRATRGEAVDWEDLYAPYVATMDWPGAAFWEPLSAAYPQALVLLSVRRSASEWYDSAARTIGTLVGDPDAWRNEKDGPWLDMAGELLRTTFVPAPFDRADAEAAYDRHNATVRAAVPAERLLVWAPGDGWEPICERLRVAVPATPFPHLNTQTDFRTSMSQAAGVGSDPGKARHRLTERALRALRRGEP